MVDKRPAGPGRQWRKCVVDVHVLCYALFIGLSNIELLERLKSDFIPLMHSFKVNIRVCLAENSNVNLDKASVNITFEGWLFLMLTKKECTNCFVIYYDTG